MDKQKIRRARNGAVSFELHLDEDDEIRQMLSRESGLFIVTGNKIIRIKSPDDLDPELENPDTPWEQSIFLPIGARDPLVARTVLQTEAMTEWFFAKQSEKHRAMMDISWEVLSSLLSLRAIRKRLEDRISEIVKIIEADLDSYTVGKSPKPLPIVEYYDIEFRSFTNEIRRVLNKIAELFGVLTSAKIENGRFHDAIKWAEAERGKNSLLTQMLIGDRRWIELWIGLRRAIEHPKKDKFIETLNFSLEKDRQIRLPTWRFIHPEYDMARPQNLLEVFDLAINNVLTFYENIQILLLDGHFPSNRKIGYFEIPEGERDPEAPMRYGFRLVSI